MFGFIPALSLTLYLAVATLACALVLFVARGLPALLAAGLLSPGIASALLGHPEILITSALALGAGWALVHWLATLLATLVSLDDPTEGALTRFIELIGVGSLALTPAFWRATDRSADVLTHALKPGASLLGDALPFPDAIEPLAQGTLWVAALLAVIAAVLVVLRWLTATHVGAALATALRWGLGTIVLLVILHWLVGERGPSLWDTILP